MKSLSWSDSDCSTKSLSYEISRQEEKGRNRGWAVWMQRLRVLPVALMFWWVPEIARVYARRSSLTTHPHPLCQEACEIYVHLITTILAAADSRVPGTLKSVRCHGESAWPSKRRWRGRRDVEGGGADGPRWLISSNMKG
jgi:hypothetical protein